MSDNLPLPADETETTLPVELPKLTQFDLARLAREIAMDIFPRQRTLGAYGLTAEQYARIEAMPAYQKFLTAAVIEWNSAKSTTERLKHEAAALLEEALPHLGHRMTKDNESLAMQVQAGNLLTKIAGIGEQQGGGNVGEKFTISINLGGEPERYERNRAPTLTVEESSRQASPDVEVSRLASEVRQITEKDHG